MKISIITVCYNCETTLENTIQSIAAQTYSNIEYVIIDGNSKDSTLLIIKKHEAHISNWVSEPDQGIYDAINKGIQFATGDIIGFLHSDDVLASNAIIAQIADEFKRNDLPRPPYLFLKQMMNLSYTGHLSLAVTIAEKTWPAKFP